MGNFSYSYYNPFFLYGIFSIEYNSYIFRLSLLIFITIHLIIAYIYLLFKVIKKFHKKKLSNKKYKHLSRSLQALFGKNINRKAIKYTKQNVNIGKNKEYILKTTRSITNYNRKMIGPSLIVKNNHVNSKRSNLTSQCTK
jgi:hypothetical protein